MKLQAGAIAFGAKTAIALPLGLETKVLHEQDPEKRPIFRPDAAAKAAKEGGISVRSVSGVVASR